ncbi:MAG TPA: hypothetical protein VFG42_26025 [Baekduia sp.]|uniref:hypothetical protein n=1 Tax=Baekduia sp. TaxID=2600305 RepID=UPI002D781890|nr:hypothetical protein [Baekduia sp.]HET6510278.1 hypothetical protein [Baekduia sp.]
MRRALPVLATFLLVIAALGAWAERQLLDADQFTKAGVQLLQQPAIQNTTAAYLSDQLTQGDTVSNELRAALPPRLAPLAGPLTAGAGELADRATKRIMRSGAFQSLWEKSVRLLHNQLVAVIEHGDGPLAKRGVTLDLRPQLGVLAQRLGVRGAATGHKATVKILDGHQIATARKAVNLLKAVRWISAALSVVALVAIVAVWPDRARGLLVAGLTLIVAALIVLVVRRVAGRELVTEVTQNGTAAPAATATWNVLTSLLREIAGTGIVLGALCAIGGWLAGGTAWAASVRRFVAPVVVVHPEIPYIVVLGAIVALLAAGLLPASTRPLGIVLYLVLAGAGVWALRRQIARETEARAAPPPTPATPKAVT